MKVYAYVNAMWMNRSDNGALAIAPSPDANVVAVGAIARIVYEMGAVATGNFVDAAGFMFQEYEIADGTPSYSPFRKGNGDPRMPIL